MAGVDAGRARPGAGQPGGALLTVDQCNRPGRRQRCRRPAGGDRGGTGGSDHPRHRRTAPPALRRGGGLCLRWEQGTCRARRPIMAPSSVPTSPRRCHAGENLPSPAAAGRRQTLGRRRHGAGHAVAEPLRPGAAAASHGRLAPRRRTLRGTLAQRVHVVSSRIVLAVLLLSSATALYMSATTLGLIALDAAQGRK